MALLLLSGLQSNAYVLGAAPLMNAPARATFPVMADQKPVPYGQPTIAGMTVGWGAGDAGQLGLGEDVKRQRTPLLFPHLRGPVSLDP